MPDTADHVASSDVSNESRDSRFAELDAQIQAAKVERQQRPGTRKRKRQRAGLPREVRKEINHSAQQLRQHRKLFIADPKLKDRTARFLRSLLPPQRKRGRPGLPSVSQAILLLRKFRRQYPHDKPAQLWARIYPEAITGYAGMDRERQKAERLLLRERVRSRRKRQQNRRFRLDGRTC
jgi:cation transport regulator ChaB